MIIIMASYLYDYHHGFCKITSPPNMTVDGDAVMEILQTYLGLIILGLLLAVFVILLPDVILIIWVLANNRRRGFMTNGDQGDGDSIYLSIQVRETFLETIIRLERG